MLRDPKSGRAGLLIGSNIGFPIIVFRGQKHQNSRHQPQPSNFHNAAHEIVSPVNGFNNSQKSRQATIDGSNSAILVIVQAVIAFSGRSSLSPTALTFLSAYS